MPTNVILQCRINLPLLHASKVPSTALRCVMRWEGLLSSNPEALLNASPPCYRTTTLAFQQAASQMTPQWHYVWLFLFWNMMDSQTLWIRSGNMFLGGRRATCHPLVHASTLESPHEVHLGFGTPYST